MAVSNLSPFQQFLSTKFPGKNASFNDAQLRAAADEFFGPIPVPPGSTIVSQNGGQVIYKDAEGYTHTATRSLDGRDPNAGVVKDNTDRPSILPAAQTASPQQTALSGQVGSLSAAQLANIEALARGERPKAFDPGIQGDLDQINALAGQLQQGPTLQNLDPQTAAALKAISDAEQMRLREQFDQQQGTAIAQLYGNRVNQSSIAGQNIGQLQQAQGLVSAQQGADAATRQLTVQQFLAQQQQQQRELALQALLGGTGAKLEGFNATNAVAQSQSNSLLDLLKELSGQQTQRDIATAQIGLGDRELSERARQANQGFELGQQDADLRLKEANSTFNKILQGLNTAANVAGAVGGGISAYGALTNKVKRTTPGA
jgi:hypothetical protein